VAHVRPFLLRGADVLDGSGQAAYRADLRVDRHGRIAELRRNLSAEPDEAVIDADGATLAPGFIDMHSHSDLYTLVAGDDGVPLGDAPKLLQGCTAQVFGQDGLSAAPVSDHDLADYADDIAGLDGFLEPNRWTWRSFGDYLTALRGSSTTRVAGLIGHSTLRRFVMGMESRPPTGDELDRMRAALDVAMRQGAAGLSTGLVYVPAAYSTAEELLALAKVVARHGGRFFTHVRSESDGVIEASEEVLDVARRSGVHLHYSHIKCAGRRNWELAGRLLELIDDYRSAGVTVTTDVHPYTAGSTTATVLLPPWVLEGGRKTALQRLADPITRERIRHQLLTDTTSWDNWWAFSDGWAGLKIAQAGSSGLAGSTLADLIAARGIADPLSPAAFDLVFDLLAEDHLSMTIISFNNVEANVARFLAQPHCTVGSDAVVNPGGHPHPRLYGTFPRVLGRYVRQQGVLALPEAVRAMTTRAAAALGRPDLGRIAVGARADLVLFRPEEIADRATYEEPRLEPVGIRAVWVGGRAALMDGRRAANVAPAAVSEENGRECNCAE
jgi:N-acyl-D-amino-acid deacylase